MKITVRFTAFALAILLFVSPLASCGGKKGGQGKGDNTQNASDPDKTELADIDLGEITKTAISLADYEKIAVVCPYQPCDNAEREGAETIVRALEPLTDKKVFFCTDKKTNDDNVLEVLVGCTEREASRRVLSTLRADDCYIGSDNGSLVVLGGSFAATANAANDLSEKAEALFADGVFTPEECILLEGEYPVEDATVGGASLGDYVIVYPDGSLSDSFLALELCEHLKEKLGYSPCIYTDERPEQKREILVGNTNRALSGEIYEKELPAYRYIVREDGGKLAFACGGLWAFSCALDRLDAQIGGGAFDIPSGTTLEASDAAIKKEELNYVYTEFADENDPPIKSVTINGNPLSEYSIVYHDYGENSEVGTGDMYAASELQKYLKTATGIELPLVNDTTSAATDKEIVIGKTSREQTGQVSIDRTGLGEEGLYIATVGDRLILSGGEERGALYGVYTFLEKYLGFRFFAVDCEIVYFSDGIDIPAGISVRETSDMEYRDADNFSVLNETIAAKLKINSQNRRDDLGKYGGGVRFLRDSQGFVHTMSKYLELSVEEGQPCLTNEAVYEKAVEQIRLYMKGEKNIDIISITQNDNDRYCKCTECSRVNREEKSNAGTLIRFVNRLADEFRDEYPDVKFLTLAYMYSVKPTVTKPAENVIVELCNYEDCLADTIGECAGNRAFGEYLEGWSALTDNVYIWLYTAQLSENDLFKTPLMNFDALYGDYRLFREYGVKGVFNQAVSHRPGYEFAELRAYLLARLMWDKDMTREEYYDAAYEFIRAYYGSAGEIMIKYFEFLRVAAKGSHYSLYASPHSAYDQKLFAEFASELAKWHQTAAIVTEDDNKYVKRHITAIKTGFDFLYASMAGN